MTSAERFFLNLIKRINRPKILQAILLIVVIVSGPLYIKYAWNSSIDETSKQAQKIATAAEVSLNGEMLKKLSASPDDIGTTAYESIKKRLMELVNINSEIRFAYFYTQKAGKIYIMADSEPVDSEDYSPPGQEYSEADESYFKPFADGNTLITEPVTDRWGKWVSILVPLKDSKTGKVIAVFGMDYPAKTWSSNALSHTIEAGIVAITIILLLLAFYKLLNNIKALKEEKNKLNLAKEEIINSAAEIRKSEEKFSKAFQSGAVLMTISRIEDGCFIDVNEAFLKTLGFKREEVIGRTSADLELFADKGQRVLIKKIFDAEGRVSNFEALVKGRDGYIYTGILSVDPIDAEDAPCWLITMTDITDLKKADTALRESESFQHLLTDSISAGIIIVDARTHIIEQANPYAARLFGSTEEQIIGQICHNFICPAQLGACPITDKGQDVDNSDRVLLCSDRGQVPILKSAKRIQIRGEEKLLETFIDITERKAAEEALKENDIRLRAITESAQDAIIMMDQNGVISFWNTAAERIIGYTSADAIGQNLHTLIVPSKYHEAHRMAFPVFQQSGQGGAIGKTLDLEARRKDNTVISVQLSLSAVYIDSSWHSVGIIRDITAQKQAEQELIKAKEQAEAATVAKSEFLANMSHEIRTPMNAIIGFSGLIKNTDMTPKQKDYTNKIDSSAKSLLGIINDILDFSKIEAGKLEMESVDFNLDDVISNILGMISVKTAEKNIELLNNISAKVPLALKGDPLRLGQVLVNLANNAVKFTQKGHILLKTELASKDDDSCRIRFSVSDTGIGMTPEHIGKLFSAFSQADSSVTRRFGGTGLGLTISKRLVEMMDGEISAESQFGSGSTFTFTAEFKIQTDKKEHRAFDAQKLSKLKVLIADDNEMARDILKKQLASFGINACMVDSGPAAIAEIKKQPAKKPYDLVFMDWRMPGMDGLQAAKEIKFAKDMGQAPFIVIVTAFGREEVVKQAEKIGINAFLMKPVNQSLLFDTIVNVFGLNTAESLIRTANKKDAAELAQADLTDTINGARILLVEDNILNQEVATEILKSAGAIVDIAGNGMQAVEAVAGFNYDIVLMDLQMPVMGGYEATKLIRSNEKFKDLPIIAMTAHAMAGAKEECIAAGLNDYVSKPIEPQQLFSVIRKWIKRAAAGDRRQIRKTSGNGGNADNAISGVNEIVDTANKTSISAAGSFAGTDIPADKTSGRINPASRANAAADRQDNTTGENTADIELPESITGVDIPSGLKRLGGNRKLYRKLLVDFSKSYSLLPQDIARAIKQKDADTALRLAHTLKGVAGNISAWHIQSIATELEAAISHNAYEKYEGLLAELGMALKSFDKPLKGLTKTENTQALSQAGTVPHSLHDTETTLRKLAGLVWEDNIDAETCLEELKGCISGSEFGKEIQELTESIGSFDFEAAKDPLKRIAGKMNMELRGK